MKRLISLFFLVFLTGCATGGVNRFIPEQSGTAKLFHWNQGIYAHGVLFRGDISKSELFAINPRTGGVMFARQPLGKFELGPALSREFPCIGRLDLQPEADYTLYLVWARFDGRIVDEADLIHFRTRINPAEDCRTDQLGRMTCASVIVDLPKARIGGSRDFSFQKTLPVGEWLKALLDL